MTEEEIEKQAEEYAIKITDSLENKGVLTAGESNQRYVGIVQGAKWGMEHAIEWHDLRENPNDLPMEEDMLVRVITRNKGELICTTLLDFGKIIFRFTYNSAWLDNDDVIAWCELPTYKE